MAHEVKSGMTDYSILVFIPDSTSTDGSGKTGLVAANLTVSGTRVETDNDVTVTDYTSSLNNLAALTTAHTDWGLLEVSSTLAPGLYRLDIADAIFAAGAWSVVVYVMITTNAAVATPIEFILVPQSPIDGVLLAPTTHTSAVIPTVTTLTNLPAITADWLTATGIAGDAITAAKIADGAIDAATFAAGAINAAAIASDAITDSKVASDVTIASVTGAVGSVTGPVGSVTAAITLPTIPTAWITADGIATDAIGSAELAGSAITKIQVGLSTLDAAGVRAAVGLASANLDTQLNTIELRQRGNVIAQGTLGATGNDTTHLHLNGLAYIDDVLIDSLIVIFDVSTGLYYSTWITDWVASTDLATVPILPFIPQASTDTYWLYPSVAESPTGVFPTASEIADEVEQRTIAGVDIVNAIADGAIINDTLASSAVTKITTGLATTVQLDAAAQEIIDTGQDNWVTADCGSGGDCSGNGGSSLTFTINDGTDPIEGATVRATYLTTTGLGDTDSSGEVVLGLENGTNLVVITAPGYTSLSTTLVVSGDGAQTYSLDEIVITPSSNPLTTTGYFTVYNYAMATVAGHSIFYRLVEHPLGSGYGHVQAWQTATSDGSGIIALALVKGATYEYGTLKTVTEEHYVPLTAGSTWEMPNIIL